ncbi:MAG: LPS export ABC transporter periplasmic protein LptC, partial [Desulfosalsimonas sp.]
PVDLSGRRGEFNTKTRDMSISGSVLGRYDGYILTTQSLHYTDGSNIIYTDSGITVIGSSSRFSANSGKFELDTGSLILDGHVDVRVNKVEDF